MKLDISPMLNAYPDSMGGTLHDIVQLLARPEFENVFGSFYILPACSTPIWTVVFQLLTIP